jgi:uncharacterized protein YdeI (YjbR/CyaY-like superfamily)
MKVTHFISASAFRRWLEENHDQVRELWVGFYKKDSGKTGITYGEALNEALCFGWIDGIKKRVDVLSYTHRFTPRQPRSIWSLVNIKRAQELIRLGLMMPAGLKAFEARDAQRSGIYSFENDARQLGVTYEKKFKANKEAWGFFQAQPPGYRRLASWWVMSAKQDATRWRRLDRLVSDSDQRRRLAALAGPPQKSL